MCSHDLNPIENICDVLKRPQRELSQPLVDDIRVIQIIRMGFMTLLYNIIQCYDSRFKVTHNRQF